MRAKIKRLLARCNCQPDKKADAIELAPEQAEWLVLHDAG